MKEDDVRLLFGERRRLCPYCHKMIATKGGKFVNHNTFMEPNEMGTGTYEPPIECKGSGKRPEKANA